MEEGKMNHKELVAHVIIEQRWDEALVSIRFPARDYFEHYYSDCIICKGLLYDPYDPGRSEEVHHIHISYCPNCDKKTELEAWMEYHTIVYHGKQVVVDGETLICIECGYRQHVTLGHDDGLSIIDEIENRCDE
jgi:hypothetical protein